MDIYSSEDKFAIYLGDLRGGPAINATVYFKDNRTITYDNFRTLVTIPPSFDTLKLNITYQNLTVTLDGRTDATVVGNITGIDVSWGDDDFVHANNFPLNHTYAEKDLYTITVTAGTTGNLTVSDSINTIGFSPDKEERVNAKLALYTNQEITNQIGGDKRQ
jgi:hypothetical protein